MKWERELQDRYGLSERQLRLIKNIFIQVMVEAANDLFAYKDFIPEGQFPVKNVGLFVKNCWDLGGVELLNGAEKVWQNSPPTNSAAGYSAWLIDLIIRKVLEQITKDSSQYAPDSYTETLETANLSKLEQLIQQKSIEIEKWKLKIEDQRNELKLLREELKVHKSEKQLYQLKLTIQRLEQQSSRRKNNSSSRALLPKAIIGFFGSILLLFFTCGFIQNLTSSARQLPDREAVEAQVYYLLFKLKEEEK